jgi:hypothetical protein
LGNQIRGGGFQAVISVDLPETRGKIGASDSFFAAWGGEDGNRLIASAHLDGLTVGYPVQHLGGFVLQLSDRG